MSSGKEPKLTRALDREKERVAAPGRKEAERSDPLGLQLANAVRALSSRDEALVRFEQAYLKRVEVRGTLENRARPSWRDRLHATLRLAFGVLPDLRPEQTEQREASAEFLAHLVDALETIPRDTARVYEGHLTFKHIPFGDVQRIAASLRDSFHRYADQAEITDPI